MRILANHAHIIPAPQPGDWWPDGSAAKLLRHMDACQVDMAVTFPPFACQVNNDMWQANRWALDEIRPHRDRLIPAGTIFPLAPDACEVMQRLHDQGIRQIKIHPSIDLHDIADPAAQPFYARAQELGMILDYHTGQHGTRLSLARPEKFDDVAFDYPQLRMVFEHMGGRPYYEEFAAVLAGHRGRCFGGLTSIYNPDHYLWYIAPFIEEIIHSLGAQHFIFGLDFPWNSIEANQRDLAFICSLDLSTEDRAMIMGGNLAGLLGIHLD
jgi:uncharacterized protein